MGDSALAVIEEIVRWVGPAFATAGYAIIGVAVLLERSIFVGLVMPGDVILAMGGIYASRGELDLAWVVVLGATAATAGESVGYWLGRRYGPAVLRRLPMPGRVETKVSAARGYFERHGGKTVAIGRFATAAGTFIPFMAGTSGMRFGRFLAFDLPSVAVWATGIGLIGYVFGRNLELVDRIISRFGWIMLAVLALMVILVVFRRRRMS